MVFLCLWCQLEPCNLFRWAKKTVRLAGQDTLSWSVWVCRLDQGRVEGALTRTRSLLLLMKSALKHKGQAIAPGIAHWPSWTDS
jgi:hypothetical protein